MAEKNLKLHIEVYIFTGAHIYSPPSFLHFSLNMLLFHISSSFMIYVFLYILFDKFSYYITLIESNCGIGTEH